jgi:hypothetical protein
LLIENNVVTSSILSAIMFISLSVYGVASAQPQEQEPKATVDCDMTVSNLSVVSPPYGGANLLGVITNNSTSLLSGVGVVESFMILIIHC